MGITGKNIQAALRALSEGMMTIAQMRVAKQKAAEEQANIAADNARQDSMVKLSQDRFAADQRQGVFDNVIKPIAQKKPDPEANFLYKYKNMKMEEIPPLELAHFAPSAYQSLYGSAAEKGKKFDPEEQFKIWDYKLYVDPNDKSVPPEYKKYRTADLEQKTKPKGEKTFNIADAVDYAALRKKWREDKTLSRKFKNFAAFVDSEIDSEMDLAGQFKEASGVSPYKNEPASKETSAPGQPVEPPPPIRSTGAFADYNDNVRGIFNQPAVGAPAAGAAGPQDTLDSLLIKFSKGGLTEQEKVILDSLLEQMGIQ